MIFLIQAPHTYISCNDGHNNGLSFLIENKMSTLINVAKDHIQSYRSLYFVVSDNHPSRHFMQKQFISKVLTSFPPVHLLDQKVKETLHPCQFGNFIHQLDDTRIQIQIKYLSANQTHQTKNPLTRIPFVSPSLVLL